MVVQAAEEILLKLSTPLYTVLILTEMALSHWHGKKAYTLKDTLSNVYLTSLNMGVDILIRAFYLGVLLYCYNWRLIPSWPSAFGYWLVLFFLEDLLFYLLHYVDHYCRLFWAIHVTHHSSEHFNLTTGFRSSVFQPLYRFVYFIPLAMLGFHPADIVLMFSATQIYGILVHTSYDIRLGLLEWVLVTPSHHRVHHASNVAYLDKNMGMCLIIWDRLFGTFQAELQEVPPRYGITSQPEDMGPVNMVLHEWRALWQDIRRSPDFKTAFFYLVKPPGWSHDGKTKTSKQLRNDEAMGRP